MTIQPANHLLLAMVLGCISVFAADPAGVQPAAGSTAQDDTSSKVDDLPLIEVPASDPAADILCIIVSGDGGWATIDKSMSASFAKQGVAVVGLNSLKYFWSARTPDQASKDLGRILRHYFAAWKKQKAVLVGYSFGADVIPFMASRLPDELRKQVSLVAMLSASPNATFQFHFSDWLPGASSKSEYPTKQEVEKLKGTKVLCVYGEDDTDCVCPQLGPESAKVVRLPGSHHFDRNYDSLTAMILKESKP